MRAASLVSRIAGMRRERRRPWTVRGEEEAAEVAILRPNAQLNALVGGRDLAEGEEYDEEGDGWRGRAAQVVMG